ncbi:RES family NAD+ phosphorylase [Ruegeria faecimaris]|uniref:RES family NAD+ phosphorylase n=1 Tax=Ruegeria faecimaris TaxID=686389 RepID=UPI0024915CD1|nr:RES family NAD+ phosphorylase [Ruegeria faecimaris]
MIEFSGPIWRILFLSQIDAPLAPARAPEGRFHYAGQFALYSSLSAEGAEIAIKRYVCPSDPPRILQKCRITGARLVDLRGRSEASVVWQDTHEKEGASPTWLFSDDARAKGADGLLYSSRSRPELSHAVLFSTSPEVVCLDGDPHPWLPGHRGFA